ncbi:MAG: hypothetical protein EOP06_29605 [Proteobacteria bacterium]|nr:MAG: hypothetical protein EOP06_29605 [Pseudomonadota bacterium]
MQFSFSSIAASIIFSSAGLYVFRHGKKRASAVLMGIGIALMVYTYVTPNPWADWLGGIALSLAARQFWWS